MEKDNGFLDAFKPKMSGKRNSMATNIYARSKRRMIAVADGMHPARRSRLGRWPTSLVSD